MCAFLAKLFKLKAVRAQKLLDKIFDSKFTLWSKRANINSNVIQIVVPGLPKDSKHGGTILHKLKTKLNNKLNCHFTKLSTGRRAIKED